MTAPLDDYDLSKLYDRIAEIADELTPSVRQALAAAGVPDPDRYRLVFDSSPIRPTLARSP